MDPCLRNCYRDCCHEWNRLLHKRAVDTEKIVIDSNNHGAFYRHINNRMSHRDRICAIIKDDGSILTDDIDKANEFNRYFASVGVADNGHLPVYNSLIDDQNCLNSLVIEEPDVLLAINSMKSSLSCPDDLPPTMFQKLKYVIVRPLTIVLINCCLLLQYLLNGKKQL